jgi:hypothetical protein
MINKYIGLANTMLAKRADHRSVELTKRIAFRAAALILACLICEAGTYVGYWLWNGMPFSWSKYQSERSNRANRIDRSGILSEVHPYVGYVEQPGRPSGVVRASDGVAIPVSEFGYIDDKPPLQTRSPDKTVVAILGGSVASFFAIDGVKFLESELARSPEFGGKRFVFVNLALGGYKQPQQLMTLGYLLSIGAQFDIVINIDGFNDVALYELENASRHVYPPFPRSWHARIGSNDPVLGLTRGRLLVIEDERDQLALRYSQFPFRWSVFCNVAWRLMDRRLESQAYGILEGYYKKQPRQGPYVVTGPRRDFADRDDLYRFLASIWANGSTALHGLCQAYGMQYYHFLQPNQYFPGSKPMGDEEKQRAILFEHPYKKAVETGYPLLVRLGLDLERHGIPFHDLTRIFADHPEPIYRDDCCHINQRGNEIMALSIARAILSK